MYIPIYIFMFVYIHIYIVYMYTYICVCMYIYIFLRFNRLNELIALIGNGVNRSELWVFAGVVVVVVRTLPKAPSQTCSASAHACHFYVAYAIHL